MWGKYYCISYDKGDNVFKTGNVTSRLREVVHVLNESYIHEHIQGQESLPGGSS